MAGLDGHGPLVREVFGEDAVFVCMEGRKELWRVEAQDMVVWTTPTGLPRVERRGDGYVYRLSAGRGKLKDCLEAARTDFVEAGVLSGGRS